MKNITDLLQQINEAQSSWKPNRSGAIAKGLDMMNVDIRPDKEYGFIAWSEDSECVSLIATDGIKEMAEGLSIDEEQLEDMFKLKVGQVEHDIIDSSYVLRIW